MPSSLLPPDALSMSSVEAADVQDPRADTGSAQLGDSRPPASEEEESGPPPLPPPTHTVSGVAEDDDAEMLPPLLLGVRLPRSPLELSGDASEEEEEDPAVGVAAGADLGDTWILPIRSVKMSLV